MITHRLRYAPRALRDLEEIWNYSSKNWNADKADHYIRAIINICDLVSERPELARKRDDVRANYRSILSGSHIIFFKESTDSIIVIRVLHQRMDVERLI